ncbi:MAG: FkbM family methyltransferase, partial [Candidatus Omnitrophica bacterium]|nr:FkbM family methyltransferase [Candidatus Omnitrophota bacterium]
IAFQSTLKEGMVVYDIGANVGIFSLLSAKKVGAKGMVYAFEPEEINYQRLLLTQKYNNFQNLKIESSCVGDKSGVEFFDHRGGAFSGRLVDADMINRNHHISQKPTISIDDYIFIKKNQPPHLIKIDVEGHELKVLQGMTETMRQYHPILFVELHPTLCDTIPKIFDLLSSEGYACYDLNRFVLNQLSLLNKDLFCKANYVVVKK